MSQICLKFISRKTERPDGILTGTAAILASYDWDSRHLGGDGWAHYPQRIAMGAKQATRS